jgi:predicted transcriptional regulator
MRGDPPAFERVFDVVHKRDDLLESIGREPMDVRDLRDELDASRSTVYKAIQELQANGLAERADGGYRATLFGRLAHEKHERLLAEWATLTDVEPVFAQLPPDLPLDPEVFAGATVIPVDPRAPDRPVDELEAFIAETDCVRSMSQVTRARYRKFAREHVCNGDIEVEMVVERSVVEYLLAEHTEELAELTDCEYVTHFQTEADLPFGLVVEDEPRNRVAVTLYDDQKQMQALVLAESSAAHEWASDVYERYREDATPLPSGRPS